MIEKIHKTDRGCIHYWMSEIFDANKPTIVLLPGLTADHRLFEKQIEYFEERVNILVWDAPGHASSFPFELNFSLDDKAKWLDEILEKEGINNPIIIGQSMGGYVGQMYSELFPHKMKGFVIIDSAPLQRKYMTSIELLLLKHTEGMYRLYPWKLLVRDGAKGCAETEYGRQLMKKIMEKYNDDHERYIKLVSHGYRIVAEAVESNRKFAINCPVTLICGEEDKAGSTKAYNQKWHSETGYEIKWIPNAGHNSNTDSPETVNTIISEMISKTEINKLS